MLPPVLSNYCSTFPPSTALPLVFILHDLSYSQALNQLLNTAHWRNLAQRGLTVPPQSHPQHLMTQLVHPAGALPVAPAPQHPHAYWGQGCPSPIMRQPWATSMEGPNWGHSTMYPSPFPPVVTRSHQPAPTLMSRSHQLENLWPILPIAQSYHQWSAQMPDYPHRPREESPTYQTLDSPCSPGE